MLETDTGQGWEEHLLLRHASNKQKGGRESVTVSYLLLSDHMYNGFANYRRHCSSSIPSQTSTISTLMPFQPCKL